MRTTPRLAARTGAPVAPAKSVPMWRDVTVPLNSRPRPKPLVMRESRGWRNGFVQRRGVSCDATATAVARSASRFILAASAESGGRPKVGATVRRSTGYSPRVDASHARSVSVRSPAVQYTWTPNESAASIGSAANDSAAVVPATGEKCSASPATLPESTCRLATPENAHAKERALSWRSGLPRDGRGRAAGVRDIATPGTLGWSLHQAAVATDSDDERDERTGGHARKI